VRQRDAAFASAIVRFCSGDPIAAPELRRRLKEIGYVRPSLPPVAARELGLQRLRFAAKLLTAAGSAGWMILFDEVELIGRYSLQQRAMFDVLSDYREDPDPEEEETADTPVHR
jgi:hypothetical protein